MYYVRHKYDAVRWSYCNHIGTWHVGTIASFRELRRIYRMLVFMLLLHAHPCSAVFYIFSLLFKKLRLEIFSSVFWPFYTKQFGFYACIKIFINFF